MHLEQRGTGCALALLGGNWNNGANDGLSYWNLNNTSSNTNINIGARLLIRLLVEMASRIPHLLVKIKPKRAWFSRWQHSNHHEANKKGL